MNQLGSIVEADTVKLVIGEGEVKIYWEIKAET